MAIQKTAPNIDYNAIRYMIIGALVVAAFFGAYKFAQAGNASASSNGSAAAQAATPASAAGSAGSSGAAAGGSCCGGGASGAASGGSCCGSGGDSSKKVSGATTLSGGVQKVAIDLTTGSYNPNEIKAKAGVPIELDFKGPAPGCNGSVVSQQLGFQQDVSNGGTINVAAQKPGTYAWTCSMGMYVGQIVVQ
jgi:hypothetical protein